MNKEIDAKLKAPNTELKNQIKKKNYQSKMAKILE